MRQGAARSAPVHLPGTHRLAQRVHMQRLDPARHARVHVADAVLVDHHLGRSTHLRAQGPAFHRRTAQTKRLAQGAVDLDHRDLLAARIGLARNQIHPADRAAAGRVTADLRVHGTDIDAGLVGRQDDAGGRGRGVVVAGMGIFGSDGRGRSLGGRVRRGTGGKAQHGQRGQGQRGLQHGTVHGEGLPAGAGTLPAGQAIGSDPALIGGRSGGA
jgi:hypothetical protein